MHWAPLTPDEVVMPPACLMLIGWRVRTDLDTPQWLSRLSVTFQRSARSHVQEETTPCSEDKSDGQLLSINTSSDL